MIKRWVENGSFNKINKLQETFCYTADEKLIHVLMRAQIAVIEDKVMIFIGLIKMDDQNYMLVSKVGNIDSFGS